MFIQDFILENHLLIIGSIIIAIIMFFILRNIPKWQVRNRGIDDDKDLFEAENEARRTLAQIIGGAVILFGLYFTWQTVKSTQQIVSATQEQQITERFTKAIEQPLYFCPYSIFASPLL